MNEHQPQKFEKRLTGQEKSGEALPQSFRLRMEQAFGVDFSNARVHIGLEAGWVGALAFACGNDLYFAPGMYASNTYWGQHLLAHELAHVVQQRQGRLAYIGGNVITINADPALEVEADHWAALAVKGMPVLLDNKLMHGTQMASNGWVIQRAVGFELELPSFPFCMYKLPVDGHTYLYYYGTERKYGKFVFDRDPYVFPAIKWKSILELKFDKKVVTWLEFSQAMQYQVPENPNEFVVSQMPEVATSPFPENDSIATAKIMDRTGFLVKTIKERCMKGIVRKGVKIYSMSLEELKRILVKEFYSGRERVGKARIVIGKDSKNVSLQDLRIGTFEKATTEFTNVQVNFGCNLQSIERFFSWADSSAITLEKKDRNNFSYIKERIKHSRKALKKYRKKSPNLFGLICLLAYYVRAGSKYAHGDSYEITRDSLNNLKKDLPENIFGKVKTLKDIWYNSKTKFLETLNLLLENDFKEYKDVILEYSYSFEETVRKNFVSILCKTLWKDNFMNCLLQEEKKIITEEHKVISKLIGEISGRKSQFHFFKDRKNDYKIEEFLKEALRGIPPRNKDKQFHQIIAIWSNPKPEGVGKSRIWSNNYLKSKMMPVQVYYLKEGKIIEVPMKEVKELSKRGKYLQFKRVGPILETRLMRRTTCYWFFKKYGKKWIDEVLEMNTLNRS